MKDNKKSTVSVTVKFPKEIADKMKKDAKKKNVSTSALIKRMVDDAYIKEETSELEQSITIKMVTLQNAFNQLEHELEDAMEKGSFTPELINELKKTRKEMNQLWAN